jgi:hypothetical protein
LALFRCCFTAVPLLFSHNSKMPLIPLKTKPEFKRIFQHNSTEIFSRENSGKQRAIRAVHRPRIARQNARPLR